MGGCCATHKLSVTSNINGVVEMRQSLETVEQVEQNNSFHLEVIQPSVISSKYQSAESYAVRDPQQLFKFTDVNACFKHGEKNHNQKKGIQALNTQTSIKTIEV